MDAKSILDREYLNMRCKLISLAASMDRIERAGGAEPLAGDSRMYLLRGAVELLTDGLPDRAERLQRHFSDEYDKDWRVDFGLGATGPRVETS